MSATSVIFTKLPKISNHPLGENSPNLVTVFATESKKVVKCDEKFANYLVVNWHSDGISRLNRNVDLSYLFRERFKNQDQRKAFLSTDGFACAFVSYKNASFFAKRPSLGRAKV
jgi:hypothetical protein